MPATGAFGTCGAGGFSVEGEGVETSDNGEEGESGRGGSPESCEGEEAILGRKKEKVEWAWGPRGGC